MPAQKTGHRDGMSAKDTALCGILLGLSVGISAAESLIPLPLGVKPGFSNLPVMYVMTARGGLYGLAMCVLKSLFVLPMRGFTAFLMSLSGGLLSYAVMYFIYRKTDASVMLMSISGALAHNFGQLCMASMLMRSAVFGYSPVMIVSGVIAGAATGTVLKLISRRQQIQGGKL